MPKTGVLNNSQIDPNKILPIRYHFAREAYKKGVNNNWTPEEVAMMDDIELWKKPEHLGGLTADERRMILWNMGFFSTGESLTANNIVLAIYRHVTNPECRQYLLRQAFEEAIHTDMFIYCCHSLNLNPDEVYNMYLTVPSIKAKDDFVIQITSALMDPTVKTETTEEVQHFLLNLIGYYVIMEGLFFYTGFAMMLNLMRHNKMTGVGQQFQYTLRDESVHLAFGSDLINTIVAENPEVWTSAFQMRVVELVKQAVELETAYARDALPKGILGLNADVLRSYLEHIADRRLERIGLSKVYGTENPLAWMSEIIDLKKEKNFFETRVTEYKSAGSLSWD